MALPAPRCAADSEIGWLVGIINRLKSCHTAGLKLRFGLLQSKSELNFIVTQPQAITQTRAQVGS